MSLAAARALRERLASGSPPAGWPTVEATAQGISGLVVGSPVPKCTLVECDQPGVFLVAVHDLTTYTGSASFACQEHLDWLVDSARRWVKP